MNMAGDKIKEILAANEQGRDILESRLDDSYVPLGVFYHILRGDDYKDHKDVRRYIGNIIFNMSSGTGWDVQKDEVAFLYSTEDNVVHPLDVYMPVDYVLDCLQGSVNFSVNIQRIGQKHRDELYNDEESWAPVWAMLKGKLSKGSVKAHSSRRHRLNLSLHRKSGFMRLWRSLLSLRKIKSVQSRSFWIAVSSPIMTRKAAQEIHSS